MSLDAVNAARYETARFMRALVYYHGDEDDWGLDDSTQKNALRLNVGELENEK